MAKRKYPSELNTRSIRVNVGDWQLLDALSRRLDITIAKALHRLLTREAERELAVTPRTQIPMELNWALKVRPGIHRPMSLRTAVATNGSKGVAFRIKPKGARYA